MWVGFACLTLWIVLNGLDDAEQRPGVVAATTFGTILGPMTGAISRGGQDCCVAFSLSLLPSCLSALVAGVVAQRVTPLGALWAAVVRVAAWIVGWLAWFGGGIVSFGHALS